VDAEKPGSAPPGAPSAWPSNGERPLGALQQVRGTTLLLLQNTPPPPLAINRGGKSYLSPLLGQQVVSLYMCVSLSSLSMIWFRRVIIRVSRHMREPKVAHNAEAVGVLFLGLLILLFEGSAILRIRSFNLKNRCLFNVKLHI
jgi:hypothetical protein